MYKRFQTSARFAAVLLMALAAGNAGAQLTADLRLGVQTAQSDEGNADTDVPNGGCWLEEGNWMCEPPAQS